MPYPEIFYYLHHGNSKKLEFQPPGTLEDVIAFVQQERCWRPPLSAGYKPKSLVLADWTARHWPYAKIQQVREAIGKLMQDGFTIYLWQDGKVQLLISLLEIGNDEIYQKIRLAIPEDILKATAEQHHLSLDQIHILDDYWLAHLLNPILATDSPRELNISDYCQEPEESKLLPIFVHQSQPPLSIIIMDEKSEEATAAIEVIKRIFPALETEDSKDRCTLKISKYEKIENSENITDIIIDNENNLIDEHQLENLTSLIEPKAKRLLIRDFFNLNKFAFKKNLDSLEELKLAHIPIFSLEIFNKTPNLKNLELDFIYFTGLEEVSLSFPYLTRLKIRGPEINTPEIILDKTPLLLAQIEKIIKNSPKLTELNLAQFNMDTFTMDPLFSNTSALKKLSIESCSFDSDIPITEASKLEYLEEIYLKNNYQYQCDFPCIFDANFLRQSVPNLKKFTTTFLTKNQAINFQDSKEYQVLIHRRVEVIIKYPLDSELEEKETNTAILPQLDYLRNHSSTPNAFTFIGKTTLDQGMVMDKLSQYWTLIKETAFIPFIKGGICGVMSCVFLEKWSTWNEFIQPIADWNGKRSTLDNGLKVRFSALTKAIQQYYGASSQRYYLGDSVSQLIKDRKPHILVNPRHAITIIPDEKDNNSWILYDPNFPAGPSHIKNEELLKYLSDNNGNLISEYLLPTQPLPNSIQPTIENPGQFIQWGGLLTLCMAVNQSDILNLLPSATALSKEELRGIFVRSTKGHPAWVVGLRNHNPHCKKYVEALLQQFIRLNEGDVIQQLIDSLQHLSPEEQNEIVPSLLSKSSTETISLDSKTKQEEIPLYKTIPAVSESYQPLIQAIQEKSQKNYYIKRLREKYKPVTNPLRLEDYAKQLTKKIFPAYS